MIKDVIKINFNFYVVYVYRIDTDTSYIDPFYGTLKFEEDKLVSVVSDYLESFKKIVNIDGIIFILITKEDIKQIENMYNTFNLKISEMNLDLKTEYVKNRNDCFKVLRKVNYLNKINRMGNKNGNKPE